MTRGYVRRPEDDAVLADPLIQQVFSESFDGMYSMSKKMVEYVDNHVGWCLRQVPGLFLRDGLYLVV